MKKKSNYKFERIRANLIYATILILIGYYFFSFEKVHPTSEYVSAKVKSVVPAHTKNRLKHIVTIETDEGYEFVKVVEANTGYQPGQLLKLNAYKSKSGDKVEYKIVGRY